MTRAYRTVRELPRNCVVRLVREKILPELRSREVSLGGYWAREMPSVAAGLAE